MKRFTHHGQRVRIRDHELDGKLGTVVRLRISDGNAWVDVDDGLPDALRQFPADDEHGRGNRIILQPHECEPLP